MAGVKRALFVFLSALRFGSRRPLSPECGLGAPGCLPLTLCGPHSSGDCLEVFSGAEVAAIIAARIAPETTAAIVFVVAVVVAQKRVELLLLLLLLLLQALGALSAPPCLLERVSLPHPSASRFSLRSRPPPPHSTSPKRSALQCNKDDEGRMEEAPAR